MVSGEFWLVILCFAVLMYVILDGFDLGLGILYPWFENHQQRGIMMTSIAHVWDGNETWLVFGGVVLFAAFPPVYALLLSSAYLPVIVMLLALVMRGAAFEYRFKSNSSRLWWDRAFSFGSSIAGFCQGFILGCVVTGKFELQWFSVLTGFSVMAGYALLACGWLIIKTSGEMQIRAAQLAKKLTVIVSCCFALVSCSSLYLDPQLWQRWFGWPIGILLVPLPLLAASIALWLYLHCDHLSKTVQHSTSSRALKLPFGLTVALFVVGLLGLGVGMYPYLIPGVWRYQDALAPESSLGFVSYGVIILLPLILAYTFYGYRVFRGKV